MMWGSIALTYCKSFSSRLSVFLLLALPFLFGSGFAFAYTLGTTTVSPSVITIGSQVTITASLNGSVSIDTISFSDPLTSAAPVCSLPTSTNAVVCTYTPSELGLHTVTVTSSGGGPTRTVTFTVNAPTISLTPTSLSNGTYLVPYSATISASGGTGPHNFAVTGGALPGGLSLSTSGALTGTPSAAGSFNFTVTATASGGYTGSRAYSLTIGKATSSTSLSALPANPSVGDMVTLTATVSPSSATGTVTFKDGATTLSTSAVSGGIATFTTTSLGVGVHSLTATYNGDSNFTSSTSSPQSVTVSKTNTTTAVTATPNPAVSGQTVTLTATVSPSTATGSILFKDGATTLATVAISGGTASHTLNSLSVGNHTITAEYSGDAAYNSSSGNTSLSIIKIDTSTTLVVSNANPIFGTSITFTATVSPSATGSVTFKDGATTLATVALSGSTASYSTSLLTVGGHTVTAEYSGDSTHNPSISANVGVTVGKITTSTSLSASATSVDVGTHVTLTASVSPSATGIVIFKDGATTIATVALDGSSSATFTTNALSVGAHSITAAYQGNSTHDGSTSSVVTITVNVIATNTTLSASATNIVFPASVTLVATVSPASAGGSVTFKDGSVILGTVTLSNGTASLTVNTLSPGNHAITASYSGDASHAASTSATVVVTAKRPDPTLDANVRGILSSQVQAVQRFATAQISNVQQRLEQLHNEDVAPISFGMGFVALDQSCRASLDPACTAVNPSQRAMAYAPQDKGGAKIFSGFDQPDPATAPMPFGNPREYSPFAIWTAGSVIFGHENLLGQPADNRFTASGLSVGFDTRVMPGFKVGAAFGFGSDRTDIANSFAFNRGHSSSATLYASWRMFGSVFLDGLIGHGRVNFTSGRPAPFDGSWITGERDARMTFGSLILTSEQVFRQMRLAPYTRLDVIHANLRAYSEQGPLDWVLTYGSSARTSTSAVLGLRAQYDWLIGNGNVISPIMRVEYAHLFGGSLTQSMFYAADPTTQYGLSLSPYAANTFGGSFGLKASGSNGVSGQLEYLLSGSTEGGLRGQGLRGMLRVAF